MGELGPVGKRRAGEGIGGAPETDRKGELSTCEVRPAGTRPIDHVAEGGAPVVVPMADGTGGPERPRLPVPSGVLAHSALFDDVLHLDEGEHVLLPGRGEIATSIVHDREGRLVKIEGAVHGEPQERLAMLGIRAPKASDPPQPWKDGLLVPVMTPLDQQRHLLRNAAAEVLHQGDVGLGWIHGRTGVYFAPSADGPTRVVMLKGDGQEHRANRAQRRPSALVAADGTSIRPGRDFRPSAYASKPIRGARTYMSWAVTGAANQGNVGLEVENLIALHNLFGDIMDGRFQGNKKRAQAAEEVRRLAETYGIRSSDVLPTPIAVIAMSHYPAINDGQMAWVEKEALRENAYRKDGGALVVYAYEAPGASRLDMPTGKASLFRALCGTGSDTERAFWGLELERLGLRIGGGGGGGDLTFVDRNGARHAVTPENAEAVAGELIERAGARLALAKALLRAAGHDHHKIPLRDISLSGGIFDFDYGPAARFEALKALNPVELAQDLADKTGFGPTVQKAWLSQLPAAVRARANPSP